MANTYDTKCHDLAKAFLDDCTHKPNHINQLADLLAKDIQDAIEFFFKAHDLH